MIFLYEVLFYNTWQCQLFITPNGLFKKYFKFTVFRREAFLRGPCSSVAIGRVKNKIANYCSLCIFLRFAVKKADKNMSLKIVHHYFYPRRHLTFNGRIYFSPELWNLHRAPGRERPKSSGLPWNIYRHKNEEFRAKEGGRDEKIIENSTRSLAR